MRNSGNKSENKNKKPNSNIMIIENTNLLNRINNNHSKLYSNNNKTINKFNKK